MKRTIFSLLMIAQSAIAMDVKITVPEASVLKERVNAAVGIAYFSQKTKLISQIAGKQMTPFEVAGALECSIYDFHEWLDGESLKKNVQKATLTAMRMLIANKTPHILEVLLQDAPEALRELEEAGVYKSAKK